MALGKVLTEQERQSQGTDRDPQGKYHQRSGASRGNAAVS